MALEFDWEDEIQDVEGVGRCFVGYARTDDGQWYRIAIALAELEELAGRKLLAGNELEMKRKH